MAPTTLVALLVNESALDPLVIGDNLNAHVYHPATRDDAERLAVGLIRAGHSIDMGIAQINSRTASRIGLRIADAFEACANIAAANRLMVAAYRRLAPRYASAQHTLAATLSIYNSGSSERGFRNGYVARVYRAAARLGTLLPSLTPLDRPASTPPPVEPAPAMSIPLPPPWAVFETGPSRAFVFASASKEQ